MNHEEMPIIDNKVSFARLLEKTHETVAGEAEINIEGVPQCSAFAERNPLACKMALTDPKIGLFSFPGTKHLVPDTKNS